jgi:hypothetical protein
VDENTVDVRVETTDSAGVASLIVGVVVDSGDDVVA